MMKRSFLRIVIETLGWFMTAIGAYFVFSEDTLFIHYFIFSVGIIMIVFYFPYLDFKQNKSTR